MPIYAYQCAACGLSKDVLQKLSDAPLVVCPACGEPTFQKQVTAAGFQLKGSGWYATDFRDGNKKSVSQKKEGDGGGGNNEGGKPDGGNGDARPDAAAGDKPDGAGAAGNGAAVTEKPSAKAPSDPPKSAPSGG